MYIYIYIYGPLLKHPLSCFIQAGPRDDICDKSKGVKEEDSPQSHDFSFFLMRVKGGGKYTNIMNRDPATLPERQKCLQFRMNIWFELICDRF